METDEEKEERKDEQSDDEKTRLSSVYGRQRSLPKKHHGHR